MSSPQSHHKITTKWGVILTDLAARRRIRLVAAPLADVLLARDIKVGSAVAPGR